MHELSIARGVVDIVRRNLPPGGGAQVRTIRLRIGRLAGVVPASLEFCFGAAASGTPVEGAALAIEDVPVSARCGACGAVTETPLPFGACPACGSDSMELATGMELDVVEVELGDEGGGR